MFKKVFWIGLIATFLAGFLLCGFNTFGLVFAAIFAFIWFCIMAGYVDGTTKAKGEMYLAHKYDEEKQKNKEN